MPEQKRSYTAFFEKTHGRTATADDLTEILNRLFNTPTIETKALVRVNHTDLDLLIACIQEGSPEITDDYVKETMLQLNPKKETTKTESASEEMHLPRPSFLRKWAPYATALLGFLGGVSIIGAIADFDSRLTKTSARSTTYLETIVDEPTDARTIELRNAYIDEYLNHFVSKAGVDYSRLMLYKEFPNNAAQYSGIAGIVFGTKTNDYLVIDISNRSGILESFIYDRTTLSKPLSALIARGNTVIEVNFDIGLVNVMHATTYSPIEGITGPLEVHDGFVDGVVVKDVVMRDARPKTFITMTLGNYRTDYTGTSGLEEYKAEAKKVLEEFNALAY